MKYKVDTVKCSDGSSFDVYTVTEGEGYLVYYYSGTGISMEHLCEGETWTEGAMEEFAGMYKTEEEAEKAIKQALG